MCNEVIHRWLKLLETKQVNALFALKRAFTCNEESLSLIQRNALFESPPSLPQGEEYLTRASSERLYPTQQTTCLLVNSSTRQLKQTLHSLEIPCCFQYNSLYLQGIKRFNYNVLYDNLKYILLTSNNRGYGYKELI